MTGQARDDTVGGLLGRAGIPAGRIARHSPLPGGTYNTLHTVELSDGARLVLKVPPPGSTPKLRYERELLRGEALFYESAQAAGVPAPRVVHAEYGDGDGGAESATPFLLMTHSPGVTWWAAQQVPDQEPVQEPVQETNQEPGQKRDSETPDPEGPGGVTAAEQDRLRHALGGLVARLHTVRGPGFGYPAESVAPLTDRWAPAFAAMTGAVLDDAERYGSWLPAPVPEIRAALATAAPVLDEVTVPALVHFDLWPGNILLEGPAGGRTVGGLIDGERMFWGDPLADFASLSLLHTEVERDAAFLAGYRAGGGRTDFDGAALRRIALYRCYLYLIMLVEVVPRGTAGGHLTWVREFAGTRLTAALRAASQGPGLGDGPAPDAAPAGRRGRRDAPVRSGQGGDHCRVGQAGAVAEEQGGVARAGLARGEDRLHRLRDGCPRGVAVGHDVLGDGDPRREADGPGHAVDDALVRLVRDERVEVVGTDARGFQRLLGHLGHLEDRPPEDPLAVLAEHRERVAGVLLEYVPGGGLFDRVGL
jgi:aminoglycoside phosphotransferase (APT) family kinase protein